MSFDPERFGTALAQIVKRHVAARLSPLQRRLREVERRIAELESDRGG